MNRVLQKIIKGFWLILIFCTPKLFSLDYREPTLAGKGPLRYFFEESSENFSVRWWSLGFYKYADKAFGQKKGRNFVEFPALIFNDSDFRPCHAFENCLISLKDENFNALLRTVKIRPRATYSESGFVFGGSLDFPIYNEMAGNSSARMGVRVSVPFKRCQINKVDNEGTKMAAQLQDVLTANPPRTKADTRVPGAGGSALKAPDIGSENAVLMRADLAEALTQSAEHNSVVDYNRSFTAGTVSHKGVEFMTTIVSFANENGLYGNGGDKFINNKDLAQNGLCLIYSPEGVIPTQNFANPGNGSGGANNGTASNEQLGGPDRFAFLPTDLSQIENSGGETFYLFKTDAENVGYANLSDEAANKSAEQRVADQDAKATLWYVLFANGRKDDGSTDTQLKIEPNNILRSAETLVKGINGNVYNWFAKPGRDIYFEDFVVDSIGDTDVTFFAEYCPDDKLMMEANFTITVPSSKKVKYNTNPYAVSAGNGGHWEISPGGKFALRFGELANIKLDGKYSWVINANEERHAVFAGSRIKNLGPKVEADVKWQYFVGNVDLNLVHPSTPNINGMIGYQFYYKRPEKISYATDSIVNGWLGATYDTATKSFVEKTRSLDSALAAANTNIILHKVKFEASYLLSGWLEFLWGGSWSFYGKNTVAGIDMHAGFQIAF